MIANVKETNNNDNNNHDNKPQTEFELHRLHIVYDIIHHMKKRNICPEVFCAQKCVQRNFTNLQKNRPVPEFLFNKVAGLTQLCS